MKHLVLYFISILTFLNLGLGQVSTEDLKAWYRPEELAEDYTTDGEPVSIWRDALGLESLAQTDVSKQPLFVAQSNNGYAAVDLYGDYTHLQDSYSHHYSSEALTISVVYAIKELHGGYRNEVVNAVGGSNRLIMGSQELQSTYGVQAGSWLASDANYESKRFVIHTYRYDPETGSHEQWINGELLDSNTAGTRQYGRVDVGSNDRYHEATSFVSELMIYERDLSEGERVDMEVYLADKYEIYHPDATWIADNYDESFRLVIHSNGYDKAEADKRFTFRENEQLSDTWLEDLKVWYRPEELAEDYTTDGESVSIWRDALGLESLEQTDASKQPLFVAQSNNGYAAVDLYGDYTHLQDSYSHHYSSDPLTISVVYAIKELHGGYRNEVVNAVGGSNRLIMGSQESQSTYGVQAGSWLASDANFESKRFVIHTYRYDPETGSHEHWVNGELLDSNTAGTRQYGRIDVGSNDRYHEATSFVSELMIYERDLSEGERVDMEVYLADKYGLYHPDATWIADNYDESFREIIHEESYSKEEADSLWSLREQFGIGEGVISGIEAWFRPEELEASFNDGDVVDQWNSVFGCAQFNQITEENKPNYITTFTHGKPCLYFDGNKDELKCNFTHSSSSVPLTISIVYSVASQTGGLHESAFTAGSGSDWLILGTNQYGAKHYGTYLNGWMSDSVDYKANRFVIQTFRYDPEKSLAEYWVDGGYQGSKSGNWQLTNFYLSKNDINRDLHGYVSEVMIYEKALSESARVETEVYLADKYGLFHPSATWIANLDGDSKALVLSEKLNRSEFIENYGAYAEDAGWILSYSAEQQAYIHQNQLAFNEVPVAPGTLDSTYSFANGLVLYLPLKGDSSDISPIRQVVNGTLSFSETDRFGNENTAPIFTSDSLIIPSWINPESEMTVSLWTNPLDTQDFASILMGNIEYDAPFMIHYFSPEELFIFFISTPDEDFLGSSVDVFSTGDWQNLTARYDGSLLQTFLNLSPGASNPYGGDLLTTQMPLGIGNDPAIDAHWSGTMNDVMIWDRALSDEELEQLYFIQLDPTMTEELRLLLAGIAPIPSILGFFYDDLPLSDGRIIENDKGWKLEMNSTVNLHSVKFFLDDVFVGNMIAAGENTFQLTGSFPVSPGYHNIKVIATNVDGISDSIAYDLQFIGNVPPATSPVVVGFTFEGFPLSEGDVVTRSGYISPVLLPDDNVSISRVDIYLDGEFVGSGFDGIDGFAVYLDLQDRAGETANIRLEAATPFNGIVSYETSVTIASALLAQDYKIQWKSASDTETPSEDLRYELDCSIGNEEGSWINLMSVADTPIFSEEDSIVTYTWNVSGFDDSRDIYIRIRSYDGEKYSDYDVVGPVDLNNGPPVLPGVEILAEDRTFDPEVDLSFFAFGATEMMVGFDPLLSNGEWEPFQMLSTHTFTTGGEQYVFVKYRDMFGLESEVVNDSFFLILPNVVFDTDSTGFSINPNYFDSIENPTVLIDGVTVTLEGTHVLDNLILQNGAILTTPATNPSNEYFLDLEIEDLLSIDETSAIDVTGKGYPAGYTIGNTLIPDSGNDFIAGGSHGGHGGSFLAPIGIYGNYRFPLDLGSGPEMNDHGGSGGGAIHLLVNELFKLDGKLLADGQGGGAGGSILVETSHFSFGDTARISASGSYGRGGGGGGRIALYSNELQLPDPLDYFIESNGGEMGASGTVYLEDYVNHLAGVGDVIVAGGYSAPMYATVLQPIGSGTIDSVSGNSIVDLDAGFPSLNPYGESILKDLWVSPNINESGVYRVVSNTETSIELDIPIGEEPFPLVEGETYSGFTFLNSLTVDYESHVVSSDPVRTVVPDGITVRYNASLEASDDILVKKDIAFWKFEGNAIDSALWNDGIIEGANFVSDREGNVDSALYFDGNDYVSFESDPVAHRVVRDLFVSSWINIDASGLGYPMTLIEFHDSGEFNQLGDSSYFEIGIDANGKLWVKLVDEEFVEWQVIAVQPIIADTWMLVELNYRVDLGKLTLSVDGNVVGQSVGDIGRRIYRGHESRVIIGTNPNDHFLRGTIDEIRLTTNNFSTSGW